MKAWSIHPVRRTKLAAVLFVSGCLFGFGQEQKPSQPANTQPAAPPNSQAQPSQAIPRLKVTTRMVTLQVLARDGHGHPVPGLTAKDFEVFEQIPPKKDKRPQSIAAFEAVNVAAIAAADKGYVQMPAGVFSNLVSMQKAPVPPTVLLIDGINTPYTAQMQVHRQMVKVLGSVPADVPVSVFLLDNNLHLLQDFTTDPKLLIAATQKAISFASSDLAEVDPRDDPNALSAQLDNAPGAALDALVRFERETYSAQVDIRVQATIDALRAIARHLSGYPGRKNLLWISSSFPLQIAPDQDNKFYGMRDYDDRMVEIADALSDAKVAVYPMDPAGLQTQNYFQASSRARGSLTGAGMGRTIQREDQTRFSKQESMNRLAEGTGGRICVNNNDLSDCVKKAMDDGSSYYELAYYPDSTNWNGEFHRVVVKTAKAGVQLAYRQGYFAPADTDTPNHKPDTKQAERELREAACQDLLTSTALLLVAKAMPPDQPDKAKYFLAIDSKLLTFAPADGGGRNLSMDVAVCTFDRKGKQLQYFMERSDQKLNEKEYASMAAHAVPHLVQFVPGAGTTSLRVVVRDSGTGEMGSVDIPYVAAASPAAAPTGNASPPVAKP
jgi:VWFA-related protein